MAIIIPGPLAEEARGKIGGLVFSRNKGGQYVKGFAAPTNPSTARQVEVRSQWSVLINAYSVLITQLQRDGWVDLAAANPVLNRLGQSILLSGLNMYIRFNQTRLLTGSARIDTAPAAFLQAAADPNLVLAAVTETTNSFDVAFDDTLPWGDQDEGRMVVFQGQGQSLGRQTFDGPYRQAGEVEGDASLGVNSPVQFIPAPWVVIAGAKTWISAIIIEDGFFPSQPFFAGPTISVT